MSILDEYKRKICSAEEAVRLIKSGDRVYVSGNAATPFILLESLAQRKEELRNVEITHVLLLGQDPISKPGMKESFRHNSLFVGPADRKAVNEGECEYVPVHLHMIPRLVKSRLLKIHVAMVQVSPPDNHGYMSLGVEVLASKAVVETADIVIVQVNENMPRTLGDCFIHVSHVTKFIEHTADLPTLTKEPFSEVEGKIGKNIAELIDNGSTIQLGIGGIPDAVLASLAGKTDLGVHTEMISDGMMEGIRDGLITSTRKTLHPGKVVGTFILGSEKLYEFADNNPSFELHPCDYTNDPFIISQNDNMVAINSAIEVDLTGQVCSDSIGHYIYSGFGGQVDFMRGAAASRGGKPIIAIPSTAKDGTISRIVPFLKQGAGVVTSRADVHYIATEHGVAYLFGKNLHERAEALIGIAHPHFREELTREAKKRNLL